MAASDGGAREHLPASPGTAAHLATPVVTRELAADTHPSGILFFLTMMREA